MFNTNLKVNKPKIVNRLAAFLIDAVLFVILFTGVLYLTSLIFDFDSHYAILQEEYKKVGYLILNAETEKYEFLSPDAPNFKEISQLVTENKIIMEELFFVNSFSVKAPLAATAIVLFITEFIIPIFLKNGQTLGMKIFGIGLLSTNGLAISPIQLFARCFIGKIAVLGIIPVLGILYIFLNYSGGLLGSLMVLIIYGTNLVLLVKSKNNTGIQDFISNVIPVDAKETIFYKTKKDFEEANKRK